MRKKRLHIKEIKSVGGREGEKKLKFARLGRRIRKRSELIKKKKKKKGKRE